MQGIADKKTRRQPRRQANVTARSMLNRRGTCLTAKQNRLGSGAAAGELTAQRVGSWVQRTWKRNREGTRAMLGLHDAPPMPQTAWARWRASHVRSSPVAITAGPKLSGIVEHLESATSVAAGVPGEGSAPRTTRVWWWPRRPPCVRICRIWSEWRLCP
jgi:hypothetical protein